MIHTIICPMDKPVKIWHEGKLIEVVPIEEIERALALNVRITDERQ